VRVTEGKGSVWDRWLCLMIAVVLSAGAVGLFAFVPRAAVPVAWVAGAAAVCFVARQLALSLVAAFCRVEPPAAPARLASLTFIIPCLNELPSLRRTVPAMMELQYGGRVVFCYVCEGASTDGSLAYLRECAAADARILAVQKTTPPAGRGAAVAYGLREAPPCEVVGFLDADHVLDQGSLDALAGVFGGESPPVALQGRCDTLNDPPNALARLLTAERHWLERVELLAGARLGGMRQFGGGQGFFQRWLFEDERFAVDESMILDDTDLSVRMALNGQCIEFNPHVATRSLQPDTLTEFNDQRFRWARGWLQLARKHMLAPLRRERTSLPLRLDLARLVTTPFAGLLLWLGFLAGGVALARSGCGTAPGWLARACLLWPLTLGVGPFLAGVFPGRLRDVPLVLLGVPVLTWAYAWICAASVVDVFVLRRSPRYAKTVKPMRKGGPGPTGDA